MKRPYSRPAVSAADVGAFLESGPAPEQPFDWTPPDRSRPHGSNERGKAKDRRRRKLWLLETFGDGEIAQCAHCPAWLDFDTLTVDRIIPGYEGGRYVRGNIRPSCRPCANRQGATITNARIAERSQRS